MSIATSVVHEVRTLERTVLHPDLHILTNDEHWTVTAETHKYVAAAGSFCSVTLEEEEEKQDICQLVTLPCVKRSLSLDEVLNDYSQKQVSVPSEVNSQTRDMLERCMATCGKAAGARAQTRSRARIEASAQEVRGYYKQFPERNTSSGNPGLTMRFLISLT